MNSLPELLKLKFGFDSFRPYQEEVCRTIVDGRDVLLVMPTGAGKSLCYQLPGLARGGTTLVISPLLALIEDQVEKLNSRGIRAERIHSGRARTDLRKACTDYLAGNLDFIFVAPERLSVPGFIEMLKKKPVTLISIDEAHCISQWGHDFRPDYRLLGERIHELRPAPVVAVTATATQVVQNDICKQLGLQNELRSIQGFRRNNIAIRVAEINPSGRIHAISSILKEQGKLPAIVYAPTRKVAEQIFQELQSKYRIGIYHAGMSPPERDKNQSLFLSGEFEVIVATVAFGMGIDKANIRTVIHAATPGSIEGYYQEIGRAGRDGLPSQAILLQSYADLRTHQFFMDRDYPESSILKTIFQKLSPTKIQKQELASSLKGIEPPVFEKALEKLAIHRGAVVDFEDCITRGSRTWEKTYPLQKEHKQSQTLQMTEFTRKSQCRMITLVRHFGDKKDTGTPCGICDFCEPSTSVHFLASRPLSSQEQKVAAKIMAVLENNGNRAAGRLFEDLAGASPKLQRNEFERVLKVLVRSQWVQIAEESFEKEGKLISFRKVSLTSIGKRATGEQLSKLLIDGWDIGENTASTTRNSSRTQTKGTKVIRKRKKKAGVPQAQKTHRI